MPTLARRRSDVRPASGLPLLEPLPHTPRPDAFDDPEWLFEPKYDGLRGLIYATSSGCEIRVRQDFRFNGLDELSSRVADVLNGHEAILDGAVVALDRQGKPVFRDLLRGQGFHAFAAFDLLWLEGTDLRSLPLTERKRLLSELLPEDTGPLYKVLTLDEHGRALYSAIRKMDLEGIVAKRKGDPYAPATVWYEVKNPTYSQGEQVADLFRRQERRRRAEIFVRDVTSTMPGRR